MGATEMGTDLVFSSTPVNARQVEDSETRTSGEEFFLSDLIAEVERFIVKAIVESYWLANFASTVESHKKLVLNGDPLQLSRDGRKRAANLTPRETCKNPPNYQVP